MGSVSSATAIVIPFGTDKVAPEQISLKQTEGGQKFECRLPHVVIDPTAGLALRLNSGGLEFREPPPLPEIPAVADQLNYLRNHIQLDCTVWDKYPRMFLDSYFAFILRHVMDHGPELMRSVARFQDLYRFDDWAFSALRPLPRAHLPAPDATEMLGRDAAEMIRVDFAFWTGTEIIAIDVLSSETRGISHDRRRAGLRQAGVRVFEVSRESLDPARSRDFAAGLPAAFQQFWEEEALPSGPFRTEIPPTPV